MHLNYLAFFLISFIPLIIGYLWYQPNNRIGRWAGEQTINPRELSFKQVLVCFVMSLTLIYGYINLIIHQMGFYELFFTDIMMGSEEAQIIVDQFMSQYGDKHRHLGHGIFHGVINAFVFALPFTTFYALLGGKGVKSVVYHLGYWIVTSAVIGGLIGAFV